MTDYDNLEVNDWVKDLNDGETGFVIQVRPLVIEWDNEELGILEAGDECDLVVLAKAKNT